MLSRAAVDAIAPLWAEEHTAAQRRLLEAGVAAFAQRGYGGTATRDIAKVAGMSPAAMYIYYPSKEDLLYAMCLAGHQAVLRTVESALEAAGDDPRARVRAYMRAFVAWHALHPEPARVAQYELHALADEHLAEIAALRRRIEAALHVEVEAGMAAGAFAGDPRDATRALLSLGVDVARWYSPSRRHSPQELAEVYADLALRMIARSDG